MQSAMAMETGSHRSWEEPAAAASNASMRSFLPVERSTAVGGVAAGTGSRPEQYRLDQGEEEAHISIQELTPQEMARIAKSRAKAQNARAKREEIKALTGIRADYPTLSHSYSEELAFNMIWCVRSKMMSFLWKKLLRQLRVKDAVERTMPGARWKRNHRWLAMLLGKEVAFWWGHFGSLRQRMHAPVALPLM